MLYLLTQRLAQSHTFFNVFSYLSLRTILAVSSALLISLAIGPAMIRWLSRYQVGQQVRDDGPEDAPEEGRHTHHGWRADHHRHPDLDAAVGRPAQPLRVGGHRRDAVVCLVGFYDDYLKLVVKNSKGLAARWKYTWLSVAALGAALVLWFTARVPAETTFYVPLFKHVALPMMAGTYLSLTYLMIVGMSNAVNLTDGLDGLAIMPAAMVAVGLGIFAWASGNAIYAPYLGIPEIPGCGRDRDLLRGDGRSGSRLPVVQHLSGTGIHGRRGCTGHRRCARRGLGHRAPGTGGAADGRHLRAGGPRR